jgi:hypothetical protein
VTRLWHFHRKWEVVASVDAVYAVLADVDGYPTWWPEVRSVERVDDVSAKAEIRSFLPYTLHLLMTREVEDPAGRLLRTGLEGDLTGWAEFHVEARPAGVCSVTYRQEVEVTAPVLRAVARMLGPVMRANHDAMMRSCERGLLAALG